MSYRKPRRKPAVPTDRSLQGYIDALKAEQRLIRAHPIKPVKIEELNENTYLVTLAKESAEDLSVFMEDFTIHGVQLVEGGNNILLWSGGVTVVSDTHGTICFERTSGNVDVNAIPGRVVLKEPDYKKEMIEWAEDAINSGIDAFAGFDVMEGRQWLAKSTQLQVLTPAGLREAQIRALGNSLRPVNIVWGPPGTGKTYMLGTIAGSYSCQGLRVIAVAPTNVAADQLALAIDDAHTRLGKHIQYGELIRPGRPVLRELIKRDHLMAWDKTLKDLNNEIAELQKRDSELRVMLAGVAEDAVKKGINLELNDISIRLNGKLEDRKKKLWDLASAADIIVTTIHSAFMHLEGIMGPEGGRDIALIVDEASMVSRHVVLPLLTKMPKCLVVGGDPRQLGPICRSAEGGSNNTNVAYWCADSLFKSLGCHVTAGAMEAEKAGCLTLLEEQSRMVDGICTNVSDEFYEGRLRTINPPPDPPLIPGWPASPIVIVESLKAGLPPIAPGGVCMQLQDKKYEVSAWQALAIAKAALEADPSLRVLLLTPFRNQANLLHKLVIAVLSQYLERVKSGTIHIAQGQEADLVLMDLVTPEHAWLMGYMGDSNRNLACVGFSRARRQLMVLPGAGRLERNSLFSNLCRNSVEWEINWRDIS